MNFAITLAAGATYDLQPETTVVDLLILQNDPASADNIYYGLTEPSVTVLSQDYGDSHTVLGSPIITYDNSIANLKIRQGMLVAGDMAANFPANTHIINVGERTLTVDANSINDSDGEHAVYSGVLDENNGIVVVPGETVIFTSGIHRAFLQKGFRILTAAAGTATARILKRWN